MAVKGCDIIVEAKKQFAYKYKKRDDNLTDQYSRLFMTNVMLVAALLTGLHWYSDEIKCAVPESIAGKHLSEKDGYTGKACWINGFYVYDQLRISKNCEGYFGLPININHNGTLKNTECGTCVASIQGDINCRKMDKKFYIQYQWYPFFLAVMSLFYYLPYRLFKFVNNDLNNLKDEIKKVKPDIDVIVKTYFDVDDDSSRKDQTGRIVLNILMKCIYIFVNVLVLFLCNTTLNGDFVNFGMKWLDWSRHEGRHDYVAPRSMIDAGELLLPSFGFCDVLEEWVDLKHAVVNEHKLLCEISQHVLYQYILMTLWFLIVFGIFFSIIGLLYLLAQYALWEIEFEKHEVMSKTVHKKITIRQGEYLMFIRRKNELVYGAVLDKLYEKLKFGSNNTNSNRRLNGHALEQKL